MFKINHKIIVHYEELITEFFPYPMDGWLDLDHQSF